MKRSPLSLSVAAIAWLVGPATLVAQEPEVLLLDEPTTALDIHYQMSTFELLHDLRRDGVTVVVVTHQLNLAARFSDQLLLLHHGEGVRQGTPAHVLHGPTLEAVYEWPLHVVPFDGEGPDRGVPQVVPRRRTRPDG